MKPGQGKPGKSGKPGQVTRSIPVGSSEARRDQRESAFAVILAAFVSRVPGARGAALVDFEGETVDYAGRVDSFELRVAAAHWRIVLNEAAAQPSLKGVGALAIRAARRTYLVSVLPEGYALVAILVRRAGLSGYKRALAVCARALGEEAAWSWVGVSPPASWFWLDVVADERRRPSAVRGVRDEDRARPVEILGSVVTRSGPEPRERAWRVRFDSGLEAMLVREPGGMWYTDEALVLGGKKKGSLVGRDKMR